MKKTLLGFELLLSSVKGFKTHINVRNVNILRVLSRKWEAYCFLITQVNPHLINSSTAEKKNVKYNGSPEKIEYHSIRGPYCLYRPNIRYYNLTTDIVTHWCLLL